MKKTTILLVALIACVLPFAFAAKGDFSHTQYVHNYTATVLGQSNIQVYNDTLDFGTCVPDADCTGIASSLHVVNSGNQEPTTGLNATFMTQDTINSAFGLVNASVADSIAINASYFQLNNTPLNTDGTPVEIGINSSFPALSNITLPADLTIPAGQPAGFYYGIVNITWLA